MTEDLIHFQWKYAYAQLNGLTACNGDRVEVIDPGYHNSDSGPDFFNAKVKLNDTVWAGNVEIHVKASDWERHGHCTDPAYDSTVLHVVAINDKPTFNSKGTEVITLQVNYPDALEWEYLRLVGSKGWIPCASHIIQYPSVELRIWLTRLCFERLEAKADQVHGLVEATNGSWEEAFYHSLARSFGLKVNATPFELLAKATPLQILGRIRDNLTQLEALLFGQAGMLEDPNQDDSPYYQTLVREYQFLMNKHSLKPMPLHLWKFMRLRPVAFPTLRIAQFAMLTHSSSRLFSKTMETKEFKSIQALLRVGCSDYWKTHYRFGKQSKEQDKNLGDNTIAVIVLNTIVPFMFAYGNARGNQELKDTALELLEALGPESNSVVEGFGSLGIKADSALFSQAVLQLKGQYCDPRKCLYCPVGAKILLKVKQE